MSYIAPYSSAIYRTDNGKMSDIVSVFDFISLSLQAAIRAGTSTTDVSSYLTAMHAAVPAGVTFLFPAGQYNIGAGSTAMTGRVIYAVGVTFTGGGSITGALFPVSSTGISTLAGGGLGGSQAAATANQIPVFPGTAGAAIPTSASTWFDNLCSATIGHVWARFTGGWACGANAVADVRYWGAACNGSRDDTAEINAAFASGAKWFVIPATCNVTGLNSPPQGAHITGVSRYVGVLQTTSTTADVLPITNTYVTVDNLGFNSTVIRSAGSYINATNATSFELSNFYMLNGFNGVYVQSTIARISNGDIYNFTGTRIIINGGNEHFIDSIVGDNAVGNALAGVDIQASGAVYMSRVSMIKSGNGLNIRPSGTNAVHWAFIVSSAFDTGTGSGILISPSDTAIVGGFSCVQCWASSNTEDGVTIAKGASATVDGIEFIGLRAINNTKRGVLATAGLNLSFLGGQIAGNSAGASGSFEGMAFSAVTGLKVEGVASGAVAGNGSTQSYNLAVSSTTDHYTLTGNYLCGFVTGALNDAASGVNKTVHSNDCATNTGTTGTGAIALATSPTFVTPALGTPASGNGTNITNVNAATLGGATFAAPGAIGGGTPSSGAFTTITSTGFHQTAASPNFIIVETTAGSAGLSIIDNTRNNWKIAADLTVGSTLELYDDTAGASRLQINTTGLVTVKQTFAVEGIASDAANTDTTVCQNTTTHVFLAGSGALGVCLGTSGAQFKTAFAPMKAGLDDLMKIDFINYRYRDGYGDSGVRVQYGATAQNVEAAIPDLARHNNKGETINYDSGALLFVGLRAIQQLKADNNNLQDEIRELRRMIAQ